MKKRVNKFIYWIPRILSIIFILFLIVLSFDVFEDSKEFTQIILDLLIHNIPAIILIFILWISWNREIIISIGFFSGSILYATSVLFKISKTGFEWYYALYLTQISGIAVIIGFLFLICWIKRRN